MRRYAQVSGTFLGVVALGQLIRAVMGWPLQVADTSVPVWASVCASAFTAALAVWAYRAVQHAA